MTGCPDPECHVDFMDVFRAYVQRGRWARAWKTEAQILARRNRELEANIKRLVDGIDEVMSERNMFEDELAWRTGNVVERAES